jgi:hypothetical protein
MNESSGPAFTEGIQASAEAQVTLTQREFVTATLLMSLKTFRWVLAVWVTIALFSLIAAFGPPRENSPTLWSSTLPLAVLIILIGFVWLGGLLQFRGLAPERLTYRWRFFPSYVEMDSKVANARVHWSAFVMVKETATLFLFFPHKSVSQIVPKRCFTSIGDVDKVRALCRQNLGARAKVRQ